MPVNSSNLSKNFNSLKILENVYHYKSKKKVRKEKKQTVNIRKKLLSSIIKNLRLKKKTLGKIDLKIFVDNLTDSNKNKLNISNHQKNHNFINCGQLTAIHTNLQTFSNYLVKTLIGKLFFLHIFNNLKKSQNLVLNSDLFLILRPNKISLRRIDFFSYVSIFLTKQNSFFYIYNIAFRASLLVVKNYKKNPSYQQQTYLLKSFITKYRSIPYSILLIYLNRTYRFCGFFSLITKNSSIINLFLKRRLKLETRNLESFQRKIILFSFEKTLNKLLWQANKKRHNKNSNTWIFKKYCLKTIFYMQYNPHFWVKSLCYRKKIQNISFFKNTIKFNPNFEQEKAKSILKKLFFYKLSLSNNFNTFNDLQKFSLNSVCSWGE